MGRICFTLIVILISVSQVISQVSINEAQPTQTKVSGTQDTGKIPRLLESRPVEEDKDSVKLKGDDIKKNLPSNPSELQKVRVLNRQNARVWERKGSLNNGANDHPSEHQHMMDDGSRDQHMMDGPNDVRDHQHMMDGRNDVRDHQHMIDDGSRDQRMMDGPRDAWRDHQHMMDDGSRSQHMMDGPSNARDHQNMMDDGSRDQHMMDGPRDAWDHQHMMDDGPRDQHMMDGPRDVWDHQHMMDGHRDAWDHQHMMDDGPRDLHMMDGPRYTHLDHQHMMDARPQEQRDEHVLNGAQGLAAIEEKRTTPLQKPAESIDVGDEDDITGLGNSGVWGDFSTSWHDDNDNDEGNLSQEEMDDMMRQHYEGFMASSGRRHGYKHDHYHHYHHSPGHCLFWLSLVVVSTVLLVGWAVRRFMKKWRAAAACGQHTKQPYVAVSTTDDSDAVVQSIASKIERAADHVDPEAADRINTKVALLKAAYPAPGPHTSE